jgi:hypothetical protein
MSPNRDPRDVSKDASHMSFRTLCDT